MAESKQQQQLKEITERLEKGVQELFTSEKYMEYLRVMSQFHNYSFSNTLLIAMQKPDATLVAGYGAWQKKFERNVMKGEKAIKIFAPAPRKVEVERDVIDPDTKRPVLDENGEPKKETVTIQKPYFKVTSVFDVSQTDGKPLPELATVQDLTGSVEGYAMFFEALRRTSKVPMDFEVIEGDSHGYYHQVEKRIAIAEGMSEAQNVKTAIHEIAHSRLHDVDMADAENGVMVDRRTREVQAESVAYTVCQRYGIETSEYSFGYIAGWSNGREMKELRSSMEVIRREADSMIKEIDANIEAIRKERALQSEQEQPFIKQFYVVEDLEIKGPLSIQRFEDMDTALNAYFALPNEKMKAFGIENSNPLPGSLDFIQCINGIDRIVVDYLRVEGWKNPEIIAATERMDVALDLHDAQIAYRIGEQYFSIQHTEEGFDYSFYDENYHLMDGGVLENPDYTIREAIDELLEDDNLTFEDCEVINYDDLMEQVEAVAEKEIQQAQASVDVPEMDSAEPDIEKKEPTISFYVAECGEFHNMGEYHEGIETLEEAIALYDQIPSERMNGVKSIGFVLHDDSIYDDMDCDLMQGNRVLIDVVNDIGHYRESPLVQNALSQLQSIMDERSAVKEAAQAKPGIMPLSPLTFEEARQQGKVDSWRASRRETEACAHEFQKDFSMAYHERRMPEYLQQWVDKYGMERCKIVLASTIQLADHDGRYYPSTKESAARVVIPGANTEDYSRDIRFSYAVNTHPVMVNGAFRELLNMEQERGKDKSQTVMQDAIAPKASVLSRLHDKQKQVSNTKQNPAKAQDKKRGVEL